MPVPMTTRPTAPSTAHQEHPTLTPCPCGEEAVWYHVTFWPVPDEEEIVKVLRVDDSYEDLCDECYQCWKVTLPRDGWVRVDG